MVSWVGDGLVAGYDTATNRLQPDRYHLASAGTVDLNAITRLQYNLPDTAPVLQKQNRLSISGSLNFTQADLDNNPGTDGLTNRGLALGAFLASDAQIRATGVTGVPTPQQILNVGLVKLGWWHADIIKKEPGTSAFNIGGWWPGYLAPGVKYWLLVLPVVRDLDWTNPGIQPMNGMSVNALGRAISIWSNRKPAKPVITSPPNNTIVVPGTVMPFAFTSNDGDQAGTGDRYDRDIAGAQVVYSALPTETNPSPPWYELPFRRGDTGSLGKASVYMYSQDVEPGDSRLAIINNLGFPLNIGGQTPEIAGQAALPPGQWLVKVRTADYGHPFPLLFNDPDTKYPGDWTMNNAPDANVSDWSDPIKVSVFEQVPPPIPLTPIDNNAIAESAVVRLAWQYRNTVDPAVGGPLPQGRRWVQIRRVGEEAWHTILDGDNSASTILDLPAGFSPDVTPWMPPGPPAADSQYLTDIGFESGTLGGWTGSGVMGGVVLTNVAGSAGNGTHTGLRALRFVGNENILVEMIRQVTSLDNGHNTFAFSAWVRVNPEIGFMQFAMQFKDVSGNPVGASDLGSFVQQEIHPTGAEWGNEWIQVSATLKRPYGATQIGINLQAVSRYMGYPLEANPSAPNLAEWIRLDDVSLIGSYVAEPNPLVLDATNQYEWRVRAEDDPGALTITSAMSQWSEPARFWIVPAGNSGEVKPVPQESLDGATLGCGTHRVFVFRRGGKERVGELTQMSHVDWSRVRDDISTAQVIIAGWDEDCGNLLKQLQTWAYELVIYRSNGYTSDRVWEGPISLITYEDDKVTIDAKDVMNYAYRRIIRQKMDDSKTGGTVVNRARAILMNAFAPDDPNVLSYLNVINNETDARQYRSLPAYSRTAYEEIDDMAANAGLDYTCSGRSILLWGTKSRIGTLPEFRDEDLGAAPIVSEYGMSMSNNYSVSDGNGVHGEADRLNEDDKDPTYGLVEMLSSTWASDAEADTGTYTQEGVATVIESFEEHAERSIADRYPPPVVVRVPDNTTLSPTAVVSIQHLIPGVVIPLRSTGTLRTVVATQKLDKVTVVEEAGSERVSITLSPFSREDSAVAEEV